MKHRIFAIFLALMVLQSVIPARAAEVAETTGPAATETTAPTEVTREPGYCGEAITWSYQEGTLTIQGQGEMDDFPEGAPWAGYQASIVRVVVGDGITYIGANAFRDYDALQLVNFGKDLYEIGPEAFYSCDSLTFVKLPESFKVFGESCFASCRNLHEFHCAGKFPSFRSNCLWDTYAIIYFPAEQPWNVELIQQLEEAFHGRIEFIASDGTDPYVPTEPTEETTEPPTTVPPTTVPPTTVPPTTQAPAETVTEPAETETRAPQTEAAPETIEPAPVQPEQPRGGTGWIGLVIIGVALALTVAGWAAFGGRKKGKYSR